MGKKAILSLFILAGALEAPTGTPLWSTPDVRKYGDMAHPGIPCTQHDKLWNNNFKCPPSVKPKPAKPEWSA